MANRVENPETENLQFSVPFEDALSERERFIILQTTCCLCGGALNFKHTLESDKQIVKEEASCPSCQISLRSHHYKTH